MTRLKTLGMTLFLFLVTAGVALWVLSRSINPDRMRDYISSQLSSISSQPSRIDGSVSWQLFPVPGLKITNITIGNDEKTSGYSLQLDSMQLNLKPGPLLRGKLVFDEVAVKGFALNINSNPQDAEKISNSNSTTDTAFPGQLAIDRLMLSQGTIRITQGAGQWKLDHLQLAAENINLANEIIPFHLKSGVHYSGSITAGAQLQFKGRTQLSSAFLHSPFTQLKSLVFNGQLELQHLNTAHFKLDKLQANSSLKQGILYLNPLNIKLYQGQSIGDLRYELAEKNLQINQTAGDLNSARLTRDLFGQALMKGNLDVSLHAQANLRQENVLAAVLGNGNISIRDGSLELLDLNKIINACSKKINSLLHSVQPGIALQNTANPLDDRSFFTGNTPFKLLSIPYQIDNNNLHSEAILLQTERVQIKGNTRMNLDQYALSGRLQAQVFLDDPKVNAIQKLLGGSFPLLVSKTVTDPLVQPDFGKINPVLTKAWLGHTLTQPVRSITHGVMSLLPKP